jgi:hypothetical protein
MALVSGPTVGDVLADPGSELAKLVASQTDDDRLVNEVFLRILNRPSRPEEIAAVKRAGVHTFLYPAATPAEEVQEIERIAGDDLELRPVRTLDEAVEILHPGGVKPPPA